MASAGQAVSYLEEVLRARANARRIKEHYEGTIGVPSGLQALSHLLTHDKESVFEGLEHLPSYNKTVVAPPPGPPEPPPSAASEPPPRRRHHASHSPSVVAMPSFSSHLSSNGPGTALESNPWDQGPSALLATDTATTAPSEFQQQHLAVPPQEEQYPLEPGTGPNSGPRVLLPSGFTLDPWRWTRPAADDLAQAAGVGSSIAGSTQTAGTHINRQGDAHRHHHHHHHHHHGHGHSHGHNLGHNSVQLRQSQQGLQQRPETRDGASPRSPSSSRRTSPLPTRAGTGFGSVLSEHQQPHQGLYSTASLSGSGAWLTPSATGCGGALPDAALLEETDEERKVRLARQRLLSANDLTPQEWARIGPPQDAVDLDKFIARNYSVAVDYNRRTLQPQRVARPDIFHISHEEAHRRQMEAFEAAMALQEMRRAAEEAAAQAAEQERLARTVTRGPMYDAFGVLQVEQEDPPVRPRFLDWYPGSVGGKPLGQRDTHSAGSGTVVVAGAAGGGSSLCASAARSRPVSASAVLHNGGGGSRQSSGQLLTQTRHTDTIPGSGPYMYDDDGDDPADNAHEAGFCAAYCTRPPRRRHSAIATGNCTLPARPGGVSDAHYAQMIRQQRKWLNAPAQPARPVSAAPMPAPLSHQYVRPRSSRPWPHGTAAPIPSRGGEAAAAGQVPMTVVAHRPGTALGTVIHSRSSQQLPPKPEVPAPQRGRSSRALMANTPSAHNLLHAISAAFPAAPPQRGGAVARRESGAGSTAAAAAAATAAQPLSRPASATDAAAARPDSATDATEHLGTAVERRPGADASAAVQQTFDPSRSGKRMSWEVREPVVAGSAAVCGAPTAATSEAGDAAAPGGSGGGGGAVASASRRRSSSMSFRVDGSRGSSRPSQQQGSRRSSMVLGETLPPDGGGRDGGEQYMPRKFEVREGLVLDGYMGR